MKRCAIGDIHLSGFQSDTLDDNNLPLRLGYIIKSLEFIVNYCKIRKIFNFDVVGDVINDKSIIYTIAQDVFKEFLITHKDCRFNIISGNHDLSSTGTTKKSAISVFNEYENATCITDEQYEENGILYVPFYDDFLTKIKNISTDCRILISHLGLNEAVVQSGLSKIDSVTLNDLSKFKLVILGHYHKPQFLSNSNTNCWYCGSLIPKDWNDKNEDKRFLIYDTESLEVESVSINCGIPRFKEYVISDDSDVADILKQAEIDRNNGDKVRIKNTTQVKISDNISNGILVTENNNIDITNRGIEITQTKEDQCKKFLSIKQIPDNEHSEYLSLIKKYNLLTGEET